MKEYEVDELASSKQSKEKYASFKWREILKKDEERYIDKGLIELYELQYIRGTKGNES